VGVLWRTWRASTNTNADALYRVLRALVSVGIFTEPGPRIIALSPAAELLRRNVPGSVHALVLWGETHLHLTLHELPFV
jgi:hypothetical protein